MIFGNGNASSFQRGANRDGRQGVVLGMQAFDPFGL